MHINVLVMFFSCFGHKNNYHSWIFSLISNSKCEVIDPNFDLHPISGSGLIIFSHCAVLFFWCCSMYTEIGFCIVGFSRTVGFSFEMVLMCTCTWSAPETFQTWEDKGGDCAARWDTCVFMCVTATRHPRDQAGNSRFSLWLQHAQPHPWSSLFLLIISH